MNFDRSDPKLNIREIIAGADRLFNNGKTEELGGYLRRWRAAAAECGDKAAELSILSELMGHYRMAGDKERGLEAVQSGFALIEKLGISDTAAAGTIRLNGATVLQAFGMIGEALEHYRKVMECYNRNLPAGDQRFAGLFNNMASAYAAVGDLKTAEDHYLKALELLKQHGQIMDQAVALVNLARLYAAADPGDELVKISLECAMECFNSPEIPRDGYYAHTCRKCASAFGELGSIEDEKILNMRADKYYAGN